MVVVILASLHRLILEARQETHASRRNDSRAPNVSAFLASVGVMGLGSELSFVNVELPALRAIEPHGNAWVWIKGLPVALLKTD